MLPLAAFSRLVALGTALAALIHGSTSRAELTWSTLNQTFQPAPGTPKVEANFPFENRGSYPVTIKEITTSCGCTSTSLEKKTYAPGESGVLHVVFNSAGRTGRQSKTVRVMTDDPKEKPVSLSLNIGLSPSYVVAPRLLHWKHAEGAMTKQAFLRLAPAAGYDAPKITAAPEGFTITLESDPKSASTFLIRVTPKNTEAPLREAVVVDLQAPDSDKISAQLLLVVD
jgi:hypothetical protein